MKLGSVTLPLIRFDRRRRKKRRLAFLDNVQPPALYPPICMRESSLWELLSAVGRPKGVTHTGHLPCPSRLVRVCAPFAHSPMRFGLILFQDGISSVGLSFLSNLLKSIKSRFQTTQHSLPREHIFLALSGFCL